MMADVFNSLAEKANFTYTLQKSRDGNWGSLNEVGNCRKIVYLLQFVWSRMGHGMAE